MRAVAVAVIACALGCVINANRGSGNTHPLTKRAAFDFQCAESELRYYKLDDRSYGVAGCGKRATYIETCQQMNHNCTWVLNGAVESTGGTDEPPPPQAP